MYILNENVRFYGNSIRIFWWNIWLFVICRSVIASLFWRWASSVIRRFSVFCVSLVPWGIIFIVIFTVILLRVFADRRVLHFSWSPCFYAYFLSSILTFYQCFQNFSSPNCWGCFYFQNKTIFYYVVLNLYLRFLNIVENFKTFFY